jgi:hypothetical protein
MFVRNYGLFWRRDEVTWNPGQGNRGAFRLLGRQGTNRPSIRMTDFLHQKGIYILYGDYGPYYVGLTKEKGIGRRLKDHCGNQHGDNWDRFSWFGFREVLVGTDEDGLCRLREMAEIAAGSPKQTITDAEALLIRAMGLWNINQTKFTDAEQWIQVKRHEVDRYMRRLQ